MGAQFCEAMNAENFTMINNRLEKFKQTDQQYRTLVERSYTLAAVGECSNTILAKLDSR